MAKVSAIVPVFNEEKTVGKVVETLLQSPIINEVICINDGSFDKSYEVLEGFRGRIKLLDFKENRGKGAVLAEGIRVAQGEIVAFFDADLVTLSEEHIRTLIAPLIEGQAKVTLGYHPVKRLDRLVNSLSGERALFRKDLLPYLDEMEERRFGVEIFLNNQFKDITRIFLPGLRGVPKSEKFPPYEAVHQLIKEGVELAQEIGRQEKARWQDLKLLEKLIETEIEILPDEIIDFSPLQKKIDEIRNMRMRRFLKEYFVRYLNRFTSRLVTFKDKLKV